MKKINRVRKNQEFSTIFKSKQFYACPTMVIYVKQRKEEHARVGISVSKKLGNAVQRNKIKRQVRMMVNKVFKFDEKFDTIILIRDEYNNVSYEINSNNLEKLYKRVKM